MTDKKDIIYRIYSIKRILNVWTLRVSGRLFEVNLRSGVLFFLFSEERESIATREWRSGKATDRRLTGESRVAFLSTSSEKRTPDRRLIRGGRLFEAGRLLNFHHFQEVVILFCNKTINDKKT